MATTRNYQQLGDNVTAGELLVREQLSGDGVAALFVEGNPNGLVNGALGQLAIDALTGAAYQNTDNALAWVLLAWAPSSTSAVYTAGNPDGVLAAAPGTIGIDPVTGNEYHCQGGLVWSLAESGAPAVAPQFLPGPILFTTDLPGGATNDWVPVDDGSTPVPIPVWPNATRVYCGGDEGVETKLTGIDSTNIPLGSVHVFELGDLSHGPITIIPYGHAEAVTSLAKNRIVTPGPSGLPFVIPQGGVFAVEKIETDSPIHGWRLLWALTNQARHYAVQQLQLSGPMAIALPAGETHDLATAGILDASRLRVTTNAAGSTLTGMVHNAFSSLNTKGEGEVKVIENLGPGPLTLGYLRGSAFANEYYCGEAIDIVLGLGGTAVTLYDPTLGCWRVVATAGAQNLGVGPRLITPALPAGDTHDWAPVGLHTRRCVKVICNAAGSTLTGIGAGQEGEVIYLQVDYAAGAGALTLAHYRGSAGVARFILPGLVDFVIPPARGCAIVYRTTEQAWMVLS